MSIEFHCYLSEDPFFQADKDVLLGTKTATEITDQTSYRYTVAYGAKVPDLKFRTGKMYYITIVDPNKRLNESDETNNISAKEFFYVGSGTDASLISIGTDKSYYIQYDTSVQVITRFANTGSVAIPNLAYSISLGLDSTKPGETFYTAMYMISDLKTSPVSLQRQATIDIKQLGLSFQKYYVFVQLDPLNKVAETFETNNLLVVPLVFKAAPDSVYAGINFGRSGSQALKTCDATIYDSGGPNGYSFSPTDSRITLYPGTEGKKVKFTLESLASDNTWDYLYVYDPGVSLTSPVKSYTRSLSANNPDSYTSTSPDGRLELRQLVRTRWSYDGFRVRISCVTPVISGVEEAVSVPSGTVYPNPAFTLLHVPVSLSSPDASTYNIVSPSGQLLHVTPQDGKIEVSALPAGIYSLVISDKTTGTFSKISFVKAR